MTNCPRGVMHLYWLLIAHGSYPNSCMGMCFKLPSVTIPSKMVSLLSHFKFDGEGKVSTKYHILKIWNNCVKYNINDLNITWRLFALTFRKRIGH